MAVHQAATCTLSDEMLVERFRQGDDEALRLLVERHQVRIYRVALGILSRREDAEDATQESLIAVCRSLDRFRGDSRFSTWLYRLTVNTCLKWRSRRPQQPAALDDAERHADAGALPELEAERDWLQSLVSSMLATLPVPTRTVVVMSDMADLTAPEIAAILNLSLPATKSRIRRGRLQLRAQVETYCRDYGIPDWRALLEG